ncbi:MAG TPA: FxsA family protein [Nocardioidaceae bacterium]|nr:FxsA family protein [Nocardioidaceae bacterium]
MPWTLLAVALLVLPILEIYVIIQVGQVIGAVPTIVLLVAESALGAWIVKREGRRAWTALSGSFSSGRLPTRELADAALVLVGGTLLLTPGFVTDVFGFFFVLPPTRPLARRWLSWLVQRRMLGGSGGRRTQSHRDGPAWGGPARRPQDGRVVPGEVVDDD